MVHVYVNIISIYIYVIIYIYIILIDIYFNGMIMVLIWYSTSLLIYS